MNGKWSKQSCATVVAVVVVAVVAVVVAAVVFERSSCHLTRERV